MQHQHVSEPASGPGASSTTFAPQLQGASSAPAGRTLMDILADTAARHPEASALDDGRRSLSYTELMAAVRRLVQELHRSGLGPGHRIGVRVPSGRAELYIA